MPAGVGYGPQRGTPMDHMGFTFNALEGDSIPTFEVSPKTETFGKNTIYVDLETTGLRTKSFSVNSRGPRDTLPGIMEIATFYREAGSTTAAPVAELTGYSDVIPKDVLTNLNDDVIQRLTEAEQHGIGSRVDEGVLKEGKLRSIFMDYAEAAKTGKYPKTDIPANFSAVEDYIKGFTQTMQKAADGNGGVITGWNISFDMNMIMDTAKAFDRKNNTNYATTMTNLIESGKVQIKDLDAPLRKYMFHQAMTGRGTPEHLSRKKINQELQAATELRGKVAEEIMQDIRGHGIDGHRSKYVGTNDPLIQLGEDVRAFEGNNRVFHDRLIKGQEKLLGKVPGPDQMKAIDKVAEELTRIANAVPGDEAYEAYQVAQRNLRNMIRDASSAEGRILKQVIDAGYGEAGQSFLGQIVHSSHLPEQALDDLTSGLDFVGGRTQDIIADLMGHPMAGSAHVAMADIPMGSEMSSRLEEMVGLAIKGNDPESQQAAQALDDMIIESKRRRFQEVAADVLKHDEEIRTTAAEFATSQQAMGETSNLASKLKGALSKVGGWKGAAAGAAAGYLAYDLFNDSPQVEGMRQGFSQYDQGHGIATTGDPSLTPFGSGRDSKYQLQTLFADEQKADSRRSYRQALSAGREAIHAVSNPITHDTVANDATRRLRGSIEKAAADKFVKRTILPEAPASRPDIALSYYDMDSQAQFSKNVQSTSHASIEEHPDHDHRSVGMRKNSIDSPKVSLTQKSVSNLSHDAQPSTIKRVAGPAGMAPPQVNMPSSHKGKSKVRDQGAKHFALPSNNKSTVNKSRAIRGGGQE